MRLLRLTAAALVVAASFGVQGAWALSVDDSAAGADRAALASDPDDKIPYPHMGDDGQPSNQFQGQPADHTGMSFSVAPAGNPAGGPDKAFQRAQQRMQQ